MGTINIRHSVQTHRFQYRIISYNNNIILCYTALNEAGISLCPQGNYRPTENQPYLRSNSYVYRYEEWFFYYEPGSNRP